MADVVLPVEGALTVFTDGSFLPRPRRGGIGIRFVHCDKLGNEQFVDLIEPGYEGQTNNRMELQAVIVALRAIERRKIPADYLDDISKVVVYTDSMYVVDNLNAAVFEWPRSKWMTRAGAPVLNAELWSELVREVKRTREWIRLEVKWGKGHSSNNPHNKAVDKLAKESARHSTQNLGVPAAVRRKRTDAVTEPGSVPMLGQRLTIRMVTAEYLQVQGLSRYRYEVVSRRSQSRGKVDFAYSDDHSMRAGHTYFVTMGQESGYPRIVKRHREIATSGAIAS